MEVVERKDGEDGGAMAVFDGSHGRGGPRRGRRGPDMYAEVVWTSMPHVWMVCRGCYSLLETGLVVGDIGCGAGHG